MRNITLFEHVGKPLEIDLDDLRLKKWMFNHVTTGFERDTSRQEELLITNLSTGIVFDCMIWKSGEVFVTYPNGKTVHFPNRDKFEEDFLVNFWSKE